jgi:3-keto-disaccharide hydrolase
MKKILIVAIAALCPAVFSFANAPVSLFDGKTLNGWMQMVTPEPAFSSGDITDLPGLVKKLADKSDAVSAFVSSQLDDAAKGALAAYSPTNTDTKKIKSALAKDLSNIAEGPLIYEAGRFQNVHLKADTGKLLAKNPQSDDLIQLNKLLLEDAFPAELVRNGFTSTPSLWTVKDGMIATTGAGRGVLYTVNDYTNYRVIFTVRHISQKKDHPPCVLFFCTRPRPGEKPVNELGGIQFEVPNGGNWDFRPGHNNNGNKNGKIEFTKLPNNPNYDPKQWSRVEILPGGGATPGREGGRAERFQLSGCRQAGAFRLAKSQRRLVRRIQGHYD